MILTNETALAYVAHYITSECGYVGFKVDRVTVCQDIPDDAAIDVTFTYDGGLTGTMTVWIETNGNLYGEW